MGILVKYPKAIVLKLGSYVNLFLLCVCCGCVGFLSGLFYSVSVTSEQMKASIIKFEAETEKLIATEEYRRIWIGLVDDRFMEQRSQLQRLEHLMRVPRSERLIADRKYRLFNYGEGK